MSYSIHIISDITRWQKNAFKDRKLRIHPVPKKDEIISSWIVRLAISNELTPYAFMSLHLKEFYHLLRQDFDSADKPELFQKLSFKTGLPVDFIKNLSLVSYDGKIFITDQKTNKRPFLLYPTNRGGYNKSASIRYCPYCLEENEYLKKEWRFVFTTTCPIHKVFLLDRCPVCSKPLSIFVWKNKKTTHFHCPFCSFEYKNAQGYTSKVPKDSKVIYYQQKLFEIIEDKEFTFDGKSYFSVLFFPGLRKVLSLILQENQNYALFVKERNILNVSTLSKTTTRSLHSLSVKENALLFTVAMDVLNSKENLDRFVKDNKISYHRLPMDKRSYVPFWYERFIDNYKTGRYVSTEEAKNAIAYLKKKGIKPNMANLSRLFGVILEGRKRKDIKMLL